MKAVAFPEGNPSFMAFLRAARFSAKGENMDIREILEKIKEGNLSVEEAEKLLRRQPFEDMGYAKVDTHRKVRSGFAEVIFCSGKADEHLLNIFGRIYSQEGEVMGTRASAEQYELLRGAYPEAVYDPLSKIVKIEKPEKTRNGLIAVCGCGRNGGRSGQCTGGAGGQAGDRRAHIGGIWGQHARTFGAPDHDQLLRQRHCRGEY